MLLPNGKYLRRKLRYIHSTLTNLEATVIAMNNRYGVKFIAIKNEKTIA